MTTDERHTALIYNYDDGVPYEGEVIPAFDGVVGKIGCPDCGEMNSPELGDRRRPTLPYGEWFSTWGEPGGPKDEQCITCKCLGYLFVGL